MSQQFIDEVARQVSKELHDRGIEIYPAGEPPKQFMALRDLFGESVKLGEIAQVTLVVPHEKTRDDLYIRRIARDLGIKLARPYPIQMFKLKLPQGVEESVLGQHENCIIRLVTDYYIPTDQNISRFDILARWGD